MADLLSKMHESSVEFLRCIHCTAKLSLDVYIQDKEIEEGLLECACCKSLFPIICKIPIIWDDFAKYLSYHYILGGKLYRSVQSEKIRSLLKKSLAKNTRNEDKSLVEERWSNIYQNSKNSKFYSAIKKSLDSLPRSKTVVEYGCSIGVMTSYLSNRSDLIFGIDQSFAALSDAKKTFRPNVDYILADSNSSLFGKTQFDLVLALNVLELIEPSELIDHISNQISNGFLVISDPYDYDRGSNSVKKPLGAKELRKALRDAGFQVTPDTKNPSFIPWSLKINSRATLNYRTDLIVGKKSQKYS